MRRGKLLSPLQFKAQPLQQLQRMLQPTHFNTPVIYFEGELKQASRKRVVPLTVRPQRIKELIDEIADGSGLLLGLRSPVGTNHASLNRSETSLSQ